MLRIVPSTNAASAYAYYTNGLKRADYYSRGDEVGGMWHGLTLRELGLVGGEVETAKQFKALLYNRHPVTGKQLTPRMNADKNRIPGWDFVFSVPKSVSVLYAVTRDEAVMQAFRESVRQTMAEIEKQIATRIRINGGQDDRVTGNMVWCEFLHDTTRPLDDGVPDPHSHIHAYVFNLTHDPVEERIKAAKIRSIKENGYFFEALHASFLTQNLEKIGYPVVRTAKSWELAGLADSKLLQKFSRRTEQIEKLALEEGITDAKLKDRLGARTRNRKSNKLGQAELAKEWRSRLSQDELLAVTRVHERKSPQRPRKTTVGQALDYAEAKWFERQSVVPKNRILASALKFGVGTVTLDEIQKEMVRRRFIEREIDGELKVTTPALVVEEAMMIQRVREGRGKLAPLIKGRLNFIQYFLSKEQREAVRHLLKSPDQVLALRGVAGAGKTTLLTEVRQQLERDGIRMIALAPSGDASRGVLRKEGFAKADTIARFLVDREMQRRARGQVLLIDEAGTIPIRDLCRILELAGPNTRIILSGDTGQHAPVGRGDALRLLEAYAGLIIATVRQIRRQESEGYRQAVEAMADRNLRSAFEKLDEINAILEIPHDDIRYKRLAVDYAQCLEETGIPPMVVSPTHREGRLAVEAIRDHLKESGQLGQERKFLQYRELKWEQAEKRLAENFKPGQVVQFHQNVTGIRRGSILPVLDVDGQKTVWAETPNGKRVALDLTKAEHFRVFQMDEIAFAPGDRLRITNGGKDLNGRRLENGTLSTVTKIDRLGRIELANGLLLDARFRHWAHGYDTSHSSQGKTAREVFCVQSSHSFRAGSMEQFYVSISRGRERLRIYTDDRTKLQSAVGNSAKRLSALEFTGLGDAIFMNGGLSGKQWTERIAKDKAWRQDQLKSQVEKLAAQRKVEPLQEKPFSYVEYLEMRRANLSSDGRSRSKGYPNVGKAKKEGSKSIRDPRGGKEFKKEKQKGDEPKVEIKAVEKPARKLDSEKKKQHPPEKSRFSNVAKAMKASARNLAEVVGRTKRGAETLKEGAKRAINFGNVKTTIGKLTNNPKTNEARVQEQATKKASTPKPPTPPAIRRGR